MSTFAEQGFVEERYFNFPNIINLEVFRGQCPCSCVHCPVGRVEPECRPSFFGINHVSDIVLSKIITEMKAYPHSTLRLHSVGDPILWDGLTDAIRYIHSEGVNSWLFTSLVTRDIGLLKNLALFCSIVEVSVNSIDLIDYKKTKGINAFDLVVDNIKFLSNFIATNHLSTRLIVSRVQSSSPESDARFVQWWKDSGLVDDAFVRQYHNYNNILEGRADIQIKPPCLVHWMRFNISCDGLVLSCFNELFRENLRKDVILGDLSKESIYHIWHGELMKSLRQAELNGYSGTQFATDFPCRNCTFCQSYNANKVTSDHQVMKIGTHD